MAGKIEHKWTGTVLTITSDSGTSSCDLKGAKGDDGPRGPQGAPGDCYAEDSQKLGGVAAAQYALKNNVPARNLLDNSDFRNPVNQRGASSYSGGGYCIDRWYRGGSGSPNVTLSSSGITISDVSFRQFVPLSAGTYTLAFKLSNGALLYYNITYDGTSTVTKIGGSNETTGGYVNTYHYSNGIVACQFVSGANYTYTLAWAALYEGAYDASTLPAYVPKGYAAELAECQRYYIIGRRYRPSVATFVDSTQYLMIFDVQLPQRMRIKPTATIKKFPSYIRINGQQYSFTDLVISATYYNKDENTIGIVLKCTSNFGSFMTGHFDEIVIEFSSEM